MKFSALNAEINIVNKDIYVPLTDEEDYSQKLFDH
jgi:hypothetical protein